MGHRIGDAAGKLLKEPSRQGAQEVRQRHRQRHHGPNHVIALRPLRVIRPRRASIVASNFLNSHATRSPVSRRIHSETVSRLHFISLFFLSFLLIFPHRVTLLVIFVNDDPINQRGRGLNSLSLRRRRGWRDKSTHPNLRQKKKLFHRLNISSRDGSHPFHFVAVYYSLVIHRIPREHTSPKHVFVICICCFFGYSTPNAVGFVSFLRLSTDCQWSLESLQRNTSFKFEI